MSMRKVKLMLAGVVVASAFGGVALKSAWATPGLDFTGTLVAGPALLDEIHDKGTSEAGDKVEVKTKGLWTSRLMSFRIGPGGHTGWHSHPGPVFVMVTSGTLTLTQADDPLNPVDYPAGSGFMEKVSRVHIAENKGESDVEFEGFILIPLGAPVRIDEEAPAP
jgi:quercetin dioxygenase-like cupin family protein